MKKLTQLPIARKAVVTRPVTAAVSKGITPGYTAANDDFISFSGNENFLNEGSTGEVFQFAVKNEGVADAANVEIFAGLDVESELPAGVSIVDITSSASRYMRHVLSSPQRFLGLQVNTKTSDQLNILSIAYSQYNPALGYQVLYSIKPSVSQNQYSQRDTIGTSSKVFQLDGTKKITINTLKAGEEITFTLFVGAALDFNKALENKARRAGAKV